MSICSASNRSRFPIRLSPATPSTVIDLEGKTIYVEKLDDLPPMFQEIGEAWAKALEEGAGFAAIQEAIRARDVTTLKDIWNRLIPIWDDRSFYDFVATSYAFAEPALSVSRGFRPGRLRHRRLGFGLSQFDARNPARRASPNCDENQRYIVGGVEQVPRGLWKLTSR